MYPALFIGYSHGMKFPAPIFVSTLVVPALLHAQTPQVSPRVFPKTKFAVDKILARPYDANVPFGSSGDRVWATSPQGWGFAEGVQLLAVTNLNVFNVVVRGGSTDFVVGDAQYFPSHVEMTGVPGSDFAASASFTYQTDNVANPLTKPFVPSKRWTCWSSGRREDWYAVDFGQTVNSTRLMFTFSRMRQLEASAALPNL